MLMIRDVHIYSDIIWNLSVYSQHIHCHMHEHIDSIDIRNATIIYMYIRR